jgi:toxin-antitoxin system PIN domain toxin
MMLADSNVWLALALSKHVFHGVARSWLASRKPAAPALFCRSTQQSFLRLLTTRAVLAPYGIPPLSNKAAWSVYEGLRADERIAWSQEPRGLESQWKKLAANAKASPKLWMDAYLAAFALAGGYQLVTTDKAFKQFKGLDLLVLSDG